MATTSLWHIEGRLKDLISYVENLEKTRMDNPNLQPLWDIFSYVSRPEATEQGEYVSAINCLKEIALQQMILTKKQYGKENGYIAWHGYQSFKPDEVTPEQAHQIGLQTAKEMWGDKYQITAERFDKLSSEYETEQKNVKAAILDLQELIDSGEQEQHDLQQFLKNVRKYTDPQELTAEILNDLVDQIVVHAPDKSSGHRKQKIEIYYKAAGIINIADEDCVALDGRQERWQKKTA